MEKELNRVPTENMFAQRMKEYREEAGLNQQEIADKLGVKRAAYAHYESGNRQPGFSFLGDFSKLSGWTPSYLLGLSEHRTLDQEADAAKLARQGDPEAVEAAALIRQTAKNLLNRANKGENDAPTYDVFLKPLARLCDQVDKIQKYISGYSIDERGNITRSVSAELWDPTDNDKEVLEIFKAAYEASNDLMKGF